MIFISSIRRAWLDNGFKLREAQRSIQTDSRSARTLASLPRFPYQDHRYQIAVPAGSAAAPCWGSKSTQ